MWVSSDPRVNKERQKSLSSCKFCNERGHSTRYCHKKNLKDTVLSEEETLIDALSNS